MQFRSYAPHLAAIFATMFAGAAPVSAHAHDALPLGDGNVSSKPKSGNVYSCQQRFNPNAPGAQASGKWIRGNEWAPTAKPIVDGAVAWPNSAITVSLEGDQRLVRANNLPDHKTGVFPVARADDAYRYDRNPNSIREQDILLRLPAVPQLASNPSCVPMGMIGFALTGAAIYNALDARGDDAPAHEIQDSCNGHPEHNGQYHYHNLSPCMTDSRSQPGGHSDLIGYALDGFGIFGLHGENGEIVENKDLDACHGHTHEVIWDGKKRTIYHYHFTEEYPYTIGCFSGTIENRQANRQMPRARQGNRAPGGGGHAVLQKAAQILGVSEHRLMDAVGAPPPNFHRAAQMLDKSEREIRQAFRTARQ